MINEEDKLRRVDRVVRLAARLRGVKKLEAFVADGRWKSFGDGCAKLMDEQMRDLSCCRIEVDEIWAYVGKKQRHMTPLDDPRRVGDQYTFVALDPETKIVPAYRVGKRDLPTASGSGISRPRRLS